MENPCRLAAGGRMPARPRRTVAVMQNGRGTSSLPMPDAPAPMLCTLVDHAFDGPDWTFEPKYDGLRILARFDGRDLALLSRNNKPQEARFPEIAEGLCAALSRACIVDGEVV